jgi:hypothetical protein
MMHAACEAQSTIHGPAVVDERSFFLSRAGAEFTRENACAIEGSRREAGNSRGRSWQRT